MNRVRKNWLVRLVIFVTGVFSIRLVSTVLHMTTLEKLYKPRDFRKTSHYTLSTKTLESLPKFCQTIFGQQMDPINLIFIGTDAGIRRAFEKADWGTAQPWTPVHLLFGTMLSLVSKHRQNTFMPLFINVGLQDLAFQRQSKGSKYARHHIRIWRTTHTLPDGNRVWVAAATHEKGVKVMLQPPFVAHKMNPDLDYERDYIAQDLLEAGCLMAGDHPLNQAVSKKDGRKNPYGDPYFTDGRALIIEVV